MQTIGSIEAFYPLFSLGCAPSAVKCTLSIVEANGKRYLRTPFAFLDAYGDDDHERQIALGHYYRTEADCLAYLAAEYPNWELASPIMDDLCSSIQYHGSIVGPSKTEAKVGVSSLAGDLHKLARGHKRFTRKQVKQAVASL